jgi:hypothetical protein
LSQLRDLLSAEGSESTEDAVTLVVAAPGTEPATADPVEMSSEPVDMDPVALEAPQEWVDRRAADAASTPQAEKPTLRARLGRLFGGRG